MKTKLIIILTAAAFLLAAQTGYSQWVQQTTSVTNHLYGIIHFPSLPISIAVGGDYILKTTNNGTNWISITHPGNNSLIDITYSGSNTAWVCGNALVLKSTNGGSNWSSLTVPNRFWNSIYMFNDNTGWVCGSTDSIIKTTNGGVNWSVQENNLFPDESNYGIQFINVLQGYMCGGSGSTTGYILRTINGGANWVTVLQTTDYIQSIQMVNSTTGFAGSANGKIHKTTNGGSNWTTTTVSGTGAVFGIHFPVTPDVGYGVSVNGKIIKTTNGGTNWYSMVSPVSVILRGVKFKSASNDIGTIVGNSGTILWTTNGGGSFTGLQSLGGEIPLSYSLSQNYPNPFNPVTNIMFSIPSTGIVTLKVYDISGKEVASLVNQNMNAGSYTIDFDASHLSSGVYFYRLNTNGFTGVKKMMLVK